MHFCAKFTLVLRCNQ